MKLIWVTKADYIEEYKIKLKFNTGEEGVVDLKKELGRPVFQPLKDQNHFKEFTLNEWTIPGTLDFSRFLWEKIIQIFIIKPRYSYGYTYVCFFDLNHFIYHIEPTKPKRPRYVGWPNGTDIAPEFLYKMALEKEPVS